MAEYAVARRKAVAYKVSVERTPSPNRLSMLPATTLNVVNAQEFKMGFSAARAGWLALAVGSEYTIFPVCGHAPRVRTHFFWVWALHNFYLSLADTASSGWRSSHMATPARRQTKRPFQRVEWKYACLCNTGA